MQQPQTIPEVASEVLAELNDLGARTYWRAATGSWYIKFADPRLGSLRIADHPGREKYRYKWNIQTFFRGFWWAASEDSGILRRYYSVESLNEFYSAIRKEAQAKPKVPQSDDELRKLLTETVTENRKR